MTSHVTRSALSSDDVQIKNGLRFLAIYNPCLGPNDGTLHRQIVYHSDNYAKDEKSGSIQGSSNVTSISDEVPLHRSELVNEQLRQIGLAQGLVEFAGSFSDKGNDRLESIITTEGVYVLIRAEEFYWAGEGDDNDDDINKEFSDEQMRQNHGWWILACFDVDESRAQVMHQRVNHPKVLKALLEKGYRSWRLHNGTFSQILRDEGRLTLCTRLKYWWDQWCFPCIAFVDEQHIVETESGPAILPPNIPVFVSGQGAVNLFNAIRIPNNGSLITETNKRTQVTCEMIKRTVQDRLHQEFGIDEMVIHRLSRQSSTIIDGEESSGEQSNEAHISTPGITPVADDGCIYTGHRDYIEKQSLVDLCNWIYSSGGRMMIDGRKCTKQLLNIDGFYPNPSRVTKSDGQNSERVSKAQDLQKGYGGVFDMTQQLNGYLNSSISGIGSLISMTLPTRFQSSQRDLESMGPIVPPQEPDDLNGQYIIKCVGPPTADDVLGMSPSVTESDRAGSSEDGEPTGETEGSKSDYEMKHIYLKLNGHNETAGDDNNECCGASYIPHQVIMYRHYPFVFTMVINQDKSQTAGFTLPQLNSLQLRLESIVQPISECLDRCVRLAGGNDEEESVETSTGLHMIAPHAALKLARLASSTKFEIFMNPNNMTVSSSLPWIPYFVIPIDTREKGSKGLSTYFSRLGFSSDQTTTINNDYGQALVKYYSISGLHESIVSILDNFLRDDENFSQSLRSTAGWWIELNKKPNGELVIVASR